MAHLWDRASAGEKLNATITLIVGLVGVIAVVVIGIVQLTATGSDATKNPRAGGSTTTNPTPTTPTTTKPPPPSTYLTTLHPKAGDVPEDGEIEVGGRKLAESIYWEKVGLHTSLRGGFCEANNECRAVTYDLGGKHNTFEAEVGATVSLYPNQAYNGHWWVVVDGKVTQRTFALNRPPRTVLVSVSHAHTLELRITAEGEETEPTLVWGEARVW
jgi:NPCBM/NEW2 domain